MAAGDQRSDSSGPLLSIEEMISEGSPAVWRPHKQVGTIKRVVVKPGLGKMIERIPVYEEETPEDQFAHKIPGDWARTTSVLNDGGAPVGDRENNAKGKGS